MVRRSCTTLARLCTIATLVLVGTVAVAVKGTSAAPAASGGSSVGVFAWGDNSEGELGNGGSTNASTPVPVSLPAGVHPTAVAGSGGDGDPLPSYFAGYAIGSDGNLYSWGDNSGDELGDGANGGASQIPVVVSLPPGVKPTALAAGQGLGYAIGSDGHEYAWGANPYGALGNGTDLNDSSTPVEVSLPSGVTPTAIAAGYETGYAIGSDGHLYAWGDNIYGELGDGGGSSSSTPVTVSLPSGVTPESVAGGGGTGYAIGSDGNLYAWGLNASGQLGDGTTTNSPSPVVVSMPPGVTPTAVAGGGGFAYAIGSDGHEYAWGNDSGGQLGDGTTTNSSLPVMVSLPSGVTPTSIGGSYFSGYAVGSDGNLYAWGGNGAGELGDGTVTNSSTPVVVSLPPGSTPQLLGSEPGSASAYAIVNAPDVAPAITVSPVGQQILAGLDATFTATASGFPAPSLQWNVSTDGGVTFSPVAGATSGTLTLHGVTTAENGNQYEAVFTNPAGSATTDPATLTVTAPVGPTITTQPTDQTDVPGQVATFTAAASGDPTPTVQWQCSTDGGTTWSDLGNPTSTTTTLSGFVYATFENGWKVRAVFTNPAGSATTDPATLTVTAPVGPTITTQPTDQTDVPGQVATFTAAASGDPTPTVQWQCSTDGGTTWSDLGNPTSTTTTLSGFVYATFENGWKVRAVFTNLGGSATTDPATLIVP